MDKRSRAANSSLGLQKANTVQPDEIEERADFQGSQSQMKRTLHDLEAFKTKKQTESSPFFRTTRVQTCSHVMMRNGKAIAVAFPLDKTGWKNPNAYGNVKRSSETDSWSK